jgi:5-methylcytosine-specific restriction endonuclease McrA
MAREFAKRFYRSSAWRKCRQSYFNTQHGLCERCEQPGLIVHHKIYISPDNINDVSVTLNHENLELLCQDCHNKEHFEKNSPVREGFTFDNEGNLIKV